MLSSLQCEWTKSGISGDQCQSGASRIPGRFGGAPEASALTSNEEAVAKAESGELTSLSGALSENQVDNEDEEALGQIAQSDLTRNEDSRSGGGLLSSIG